MEAYKQKGEVEIFYRCSHCHEEHETRMAASNCCAMWICNYCGEEYDTKKEANKCCKDVELI